MNTKQNLINYDIILLLKKQKQNLKNLLFTNKYLFNYLFYYVKGMQNVSISCALVCIIIVITASLIGLFSIFCHQISAMLITAVMYLLAGNTIIDLLKF